MAIQARSPYFETITSITTISYGILQIYIWTGDENTVPSSPEYTLRKSVVTTSGLSTIIFETAELIRDYLNVTFNGYYSGQGVWVKHTLTIYDSSDSVITTRNTTNIAFDGYNYFEESTTSYPVMITNRKLFVLEDNAFRIPIYTESNPTVTFLKDNEIVSTQTFTSSSQSSEQIKYVSIYGNSTNWDSFKERVLESGGTSFEPNKCLEAYFNEYSIGAVDKIVISDSSGIETINVEILEECKYEPKKVTFVNKFGALQDMYFFKKSVEKMNVSKESYKSNILTTTSGVTGYSVDNHVYRDFNVMGKESVTLSSGFLSEDYNEVFKQMMLSEKVWVTNITDEGEQVLPINVKTSDITYKTSLNDKLVDYTFDFDKSFDTINNIR
jgi:hypothetical protein